MRRCPITYDPLPEKAEGRYSSKGLKRLSPALEDLQDLPWTAEEQRREAATRATRMSIQGVQPKLSARLRVKEGRFEVVDRGGRYILKPQTDPYPSLPENEDLTMRLAGASMIPVPVHGLVAARDGGWTYFVQRFDRPGRYGKRAVEDFAQLAGLTRDTKYDFSMEKLAGILDRFTTFPAVEKLELFRRTLFCFLTGNEDMHVKNHSVIVEGDRVRLSPAYDLVNTTIALPGTAEEIALPLRGKKRRLTRDDLVDYFGTERLGLTRGSIDDVLDGLGEAMVGWEDLIEASFLPAELRREYASVVDERRSRIGL